MPKSFRLSKEEEEYIEQVELFNRAGIKVCAMQSLSECEGEVITIEKPIEQGPLAGKKLRMNVCQAHCGDDGEGWVVIYD